MNKNFSSGYKAQFKRRIVSRRVARLALRSHCGGRVSRHKASGVPRSIPRFKTWVPPASYLLPPEIGQLRIFEVPDDLVMEVAA